MSKDFEVINPDSKLYAAKAALDWLFTELDPSEIAILLRDYVNRNHTLIGAVYSKSVVRDIIFERLSKTKPHVENIENEANILAEVLVNSVWWKANNICEYENKILDEVLDKLIKDPKAFSEEDSYIF